MDSGRNIDVINERVNYLLGTYFIGSDVLTASTQMFNEIASPETLMRCLPLHTSTSSVSPQRSYFMGTVNHWDGESGIRTGDLMFTLAHIVVCGMFKFGVSSSSSNAKPHSGPASCRKATRSLEHGTNGNIKAHRFEC